ncbi:DUF2800 domain-containing protein [Ruficoccus amylovorans]|uniref:DUF2800 domain-containing protein n=1 Tax=Ruficoccus amylovorans TaxID=1804625 RepID=A0A842HEQ6_9BACT|nr:DUF2800 domain-containing protein [Ruficoccus amylovorans]MBC2594912.1 DUF2800 domain-containing protein [Ruficoccus amylovorans]
MTPLPETLEEIRAALAARDEERKGLPSFSAAPRWLYCDGSHLHEAASGPNLSSLPAEEGEMLHAVMEHEELDPEKFDEYQIWSVTEAERIQVELVEKFIGTPEQTFAEQRLWLYDSGTSTEYDEARKPRASGRFDKLFVKGKTGLLIDYKFGHRIVEHAVVNEQMLCNALVVMEQYGLEKVIVAIIQPRAERHLRKTVAKFTAAYLRVKRPWIIHQARVSMLPGMPRRASAKACEWCRSLKNGTCPEGVTFGLVSRLIDRELPGEDAAQLIEQSTLAAKSSEAITRHALEQLVEAPHSIPRYTTSERVPSMTDVEALLRSKYTDKKASEVKAMLPDLLEGLCRESEVQFTKKTLKDVETFMQRLRDWHGIDEHEAAMLTHKISPAK